MRAFLPSLALFLLSGCLSGCHYPPEVPPPPPLTEVDIIRMSKEGVPPDQIIERIRESRTVYLMDASDVVKLHENGVDDKVINYMLETEKWDRERRAYSRYWYYDPYWYPYYPHAHIGFGWHWY